MTTAKLLKDLPTYGRAGSLVPIPTGQMRNRFFPLRIADYVTQAERRTIKVNNIPIERDYNFGKEEEASIIEGSTAPFGGINTYAEEQAAPTPKRKALDVEKLTPERSYDLLDIFVHPRLDFYRQPLPPVVDESAAKEEAPQQRRERARTASSAAADLLEARTSVPKPKAETGPQGIYGSVSTQDILVAIRAAIATNDEAARIQLREEDIVFLDENVERAVKFVGDFTIEIGVKGMEKGLRRTVRVIPQEAV